MHIQTEFTRQWLGRRLQELNRPAADSAKANQRIRELLAWVQKNQSRDPYDNGDREDITSVNGCVITNVGIRVFIVKRGQSVQQRLDAVDLKKADSSSIDIVPQSNVWRVGITEQKDRSVHGIIFKDRATATEALDKLVEATELCNSATPGDLSNSSSGGKAVGSTLGAIIGGAPPAAAPAAAAPLQEQRASRIPLATSLLAGATLKVAISYPRSF